VTDMFAPAADATPIPPDDQKKLLATWITSRDDLNAAEQENITKGLAWAKRRKPKPLSIATEEFSRNLHRVMFNKVWRWAGDYREVDLENIGVPRRQIASKNAELFHQFRYWIEHETLPVDELAVQFHHRLVLVHAFTNGNGRHSRFMADLLAESLGHEPFTWGRGDLGDDTGELRKTYIAALKKADKGDHADLIAFARS
jgi:Fic-DOC domain mobile mystery protein B